MKPTEESWQEEEGKREEERKRMLEIMREINAAFLKVKDNPPTKECFITVEGDPDKGVEIRVGELEGRNKEKICYDYI